MPDADRLYLLNDALTTWANDEGLPVSDAQLDEATHTAAAILRAKFEPPVLRADVIDDHDAAFVSDALIDALTDAGVARDAAEEWTEANIDRYLGHERGLVVAREPHEDAQPVFPMQVLVLRIPVLGSPENAAGITAGVLDNLGDAWWTGDDGDDFWLCAEKPTTLCVYEEPTDDELVAVYLAESGYATVEAWAADSDYTLISGGWYQEHQLDEHGVLRADHLGFTIDVREQLLNVLRGA